MKLYCPVERMHMEKQTTETLQCLATGEKPYHQHKSNKPLLVAYTDKDMQMQDPAEMTLRRVVPFVREVYDLPGMLMM